MFYQARRTLEDFTLQIYSIIRQRAMVEGVALPLDRRISATVRRTFLSGEYEKNEMDIVRKTLQQSDRVLECGAGVGFLAAYCALVIGSDRVKTFEANPFMLPVILKTFLLNDISPHLVAAAVGSRNGLIDFHVRANFWASSSSHLRSEGAVTTITVPTIALHDEILAFQPTFLIIDIEGAEIDLVESSDLPSVQKIMFEVHPDLIGEAGLNKIFRWLTSLGFQKDEIISKSREIYMERR